MTLSARIRELLDPCAELMSYRSSGTVDLSPMLTMYRGNQGEIMTYLRRAVEFHSHRALTVRGASSYLFASRPGTAIFLAVCPLPGAPDVIEELGADVTLYTVGPSSDGFALAEPAAAEQIAKQRQEASIARLERQARSAGQEKAQALLAHLHHRLKALVSMSPEDVKPILDGLFRPGPEKFTLDQAAMACELLGLSFHQMLATTSMAST